MSPVGDATRGSPRPTTPCRRHCPARGRPGSGRKRNLLGVLAPCQQPQQQQQLPACHCGSEAQESLPSPSSSCRSVPSAHWTKRPTLDRSCVDKIPRRSASLGLSMRVLFVLVLLFGVDDLPGTAASAATSSTPQTTTTRRGRRRAQFNDPPPEDNVTPFPTGPPLTPRPSSSPTRRPTNNPTSFPTFRPSDIPTIQASNAPSIAASNAPSIAASNAPSIAASNSPSVQASNAPSTGPTGQPTTARPTSAPSFAPSTAGPTSRPSSAPSTTSPSAVPSSRPSFSPLAPGETRAPSPTQTPTGRPTTSAPSEIPSLAPSTETTPPTQQTPTPFLTMEQSDAPTETWIDFTITESVQVSLELPSNQRASPIGLANIWQEHVENAMQEATEASDGALRLLAVLVLVDGQSASTRGPSFLRRLQQETTTIVQTFQMDTRVDMERDTSNPAAGGPEREEQITQLLVDEVLTADGLQTALEDAGVEGVRVAAVSSAEPPDEKEPKEKPTQVELIVGFALVGIMAAMLLITLYSRIKSMQKRRRKRRLDKKRQQHSYVMPKQERAAPPPTSPEKTTSARKVDVEADLAPTAASGGGPVMYSVEEDTSYIRNLPTVGTSDESSDPFADELKQAVVLDEEAWKQLQEKKEEMRKRGRVVDALYMTAAGSGEEGVEIGAGGGLAATSYPYGEERDAVSPSAQSAPPPIQSPATMQHLSPDDAVRWTTAGVALGAGLGALGKSRSRGGESSGFEPYGETKKDASLESSWDLDETPNDEFSPYSFMDPLRPRSSDTNNARLSPTSLSEDPSSVAVGASMSASSWTEAEGGDLRASPTEQMVPLGMIREHSSESHSEPGNSTRDDTLATEEMLQEVERLSAYMKRYEKKKEGTKGLGNSVGGGSSVPYEAMSDSASGLRKASGSPPAARDRSLYEQALGLNNTSMESSGFGNLESSSELSGGVSESEDEASMRLGINRFTIEDPSISGLMYSVEELPIPSMASPQEEDDNARLLSMSGVTMDTAHNISSPMAPDKPVDRPHSPGIDIPEDEKRGNFGFRPSPSSGKLDAKVNKGKLSALRGSGNMLDGEERSSHTVPSDELNRDEKSAAQKKQLSAQQLRTTSRTPPPIRSKNRGFTNIISMFESKPKTAVTPPNENWQHGTKSAKR